MRPRASLLFACLLVTATAACGGDAPGADLLPAEVAGNVAAAAPPGAELAKEAEAKRPPEQPREVLLPTVDLLTVSAIEARIVTVYDVGWFSCGILHAVGAVEVEVVGVGDPPPHMLLYISCPADGGYRKLLVVDTRVSVELFARKQSWPKPPVEDAELPVRYVRSVTASPPAFGL